MHIIIENPYFTLLYAAKCETHWIVNNIWQQIHTDCKQNGSFSQYFPFLFGVIFTVIYSRILGKACQFGFCSGIIFLILQTVADINCWIYIIKTVIQNFEKNSINKLLKVCVVNWRCPIYVYTWTICYYCENITGYYNKNIHSEVKTMFITQEREF